MRKIEHIIIDNMTLENLDDVLQIERLSFKSPWSRQSFISELIKNKLAIYIVAKYNNIIIGYAGMWKIIDEGHITNIAVHPNNRNKKIGSKIVESLIKIAEENDISKLTLEVNENNILAQNLYKKFGFEHLGKRKNYYDNGKEDALIMWKSI